MTIETDISMDGEEARLVLPDFGRTDAYHIMIHPADPTPERTSR